MLVGSRDFGTEDVIQLPLVDTNKCGIYVDAVTNISTSNPSLKKPNGMYAGSAYMFYIRWLCYSRHRKGSLKSKSKRIHMLAGRSGEKTTLHPRAVMILEDNEIRTPFFSILEGITIILFGTVHDYGVRNHVVSDESIQLFHDATPPTFPVQRDYQGLNTAFALKQGIERARNRDVCCSNCALPRRECPEERMVFARVGGTAFASYWCLRCYDYWRSSGKVRPGIVIRRNSVPKPDACAKCNLPAAEVRGWFWFDDIQTWNCRGKRHELNRCINCESERKLGAELFTTMDSTSTSLGEWIKVWAWSWSKKVAEGPGRSAGRVGSGRLFDPLCGRQIDGSIR